MSTIRTAAAAVGRNAWWMLAFVFTLAGVGKILALGDFARLTNTLNFIPWHARQYLPLAVPAAELVVAYLLILPLTRAAGVVLANALLWTFTLFLAWRVTDPFAPPCECFGLLQLAADARASNLTSLGRNVVFLVPATLGLVAVFHRSGRAGGRDPAAPTHGRTAGFTLVEALVVIGIIGLLIAVLLPVLSAARGAARRAGCASNQRQVVAAALARAADHQGYLPLAGQVVVPPQTAGYGSLPAALADPGRRRYAYARDTSGPVTLHIPTVEHLLPLPLALLSHLDPGAGTPEQGAEADELSRRYSALDLFRCPDGPAARRSLRAQEFVEIDFAGRLGYGALWWPATDYAPNAALLGFDREPQSNSARRLRGRLVAIEDSAARVVLADADCDRYPLPTVCHDPPPPPSPASGLARRWPTRSPLSRASGGVHFSTPTGTTAAPTSPSPTATSPRAT